MNPWGHLRSRQLSGRHRALRVLRSICRRRSRLRLGTSIPRPVRHHAPRPTAVLRAPVGYFYGEPGIGKTSAARLIAKGLGEYGLLEINASDASGIDFVRYRIGSFARASSLLAEHR